MNLGITCFFHSRVGVPKWIHLWSIVRDFPQLEHCFYILSRALAISAQPSGESQYNNPCSTYRQLQSRFCFYKILNVYSIEEKGKEHLQKDQKGTRATGALWKYVRGETSPESIWAPARAVGQLREEISCPSWSHAHTGSHPTTDSFHRR